jgi:RNA recognition motif-containing protein
MHKSSKRKDLAFITFSTHEEAKNSVEYFKSQYCNEVPRTPSVMQENEIYKPPVLHNPLGENVNVSLAFSQQAMQAKKKVKETRKKVPGEIGYTGIHGMAGVPMPTSIPSTLPSNLQIPQVQQVQNLPTSSNLNLAQPTQTGNNNSNLNATAMLAMMNIINMNKVKKSLNINLFLF